MNLTERQLKTLIEARDTLRDAKLHFDQRDLGLFAKSFNEAYNILSLELAQIEHDNVKQV